jgi:hypothetical protein
LLDGTPLASPVGMRALAVGLRTMPILVVVAAACATPQSPEVPSPLPIPHPGPTTNEAPPETPGEGPTPTPPPAPEETGTGAGSVSMPIVSHQVGGPLRGSLMVDERGNPMPPIPIADLNLGGDARGHWLVVHFAHGWCPTCDQVASNLDQIASLSRPQGVITVVVTADLPAWRRKVAEDIAVVDQATLAEQYAGQTAIVDPGGGLHLLTSTMPEPSQVESMVASNAVKEPVRVTVSSTPVDAGGHGSIAVTFEVAAGHHVMSHEPSRPNYFALRVSGRDRGGVRVGEATYPPSESAMTAGDTVAVNSGKFVVAVPFTVDMSTPPGPVTVPLDVRYQACTDRVCLFPVDAHPKAVVDVR